VGGKWGGGRLVAAAAAARGTFFFLVDCRTLQPRSRLT